MTNEKKNKELWGMWLDKTQNKEMQDAIFDNDLEKANLIFNEMFREGLIFKQ